MIAIWTAYKNNRSIADGRFMLNDWANRLENSSYLISSEPCDIKFKVGNGYCYDIVHENGKYQTNRLQDIPLTQENLLEYINNEKRIHSLWASMDLDIFTKKFAIKHLLNREIYRKLQIWFDSQIEEFESFWLNPKKEFRDLASVDQFLYIKIMFNYAAFNKSS